MKIEIKGRMLTKAHEEDAGWDLYADKNISISPSESRLVPTGTYVNIPAGYVGLVCPRSGLAAKYGITVLNAPGIVDAGYTGEIKVNLFNSNQTGIFSHEISEGDRIAQLVIVPIPSVSFVEVDQFAQTVRGANGHGSSGR